MKFILAFESFASSDSLLEHLDHKNSLELRSDSDSLLSWPQAYFKIDADMEERRSPRDAKGEDSVRTLPFFEGIKPEVVDRALSQIVRREHPAGRVILLENDWGSSVYFILSGWVKIRTYNIDGKEVTLNIVGRGELFGEMAPLDEVPRSTDVITLTPAVVANMPASDFVRMVQTEPEAGIRLAKLMARRLRQVNRRLRLRESDSTSRVADILLFLAEGQGEQGDQGIVIPNLPHRELSSLSGMARETVTRVLGKLEKKEIIHRDNDQLCIVNLDALEDLLL